MTEKILDQIALDVFSGETVLFVGSGFSWNCRSGKHRERLRTAHELRDLLGAELRIDTKQNSLEDVSAHYTRKVGIPNLYQLLKDWYTVSEVDEARSNFIMLPWARIYTTNFDNVVEQSIAAARVQPVTLDIDHRPSKEIPKHSVIHLNGAIATATSGNLEEKIRLTTSTYWDNRISDSGWLARFQRDITHCRAVIFVGYSLFDIDISKLLRANPTLSKKTYFVDSPNIDEIALGKLEAVGRVLPVGFDAFAGHLATVAKDVPPPQSEFFSCFERVRPPRAIKAISADDARNFFVFGNHALDVAFLEPKARAAYVVEREYQKDLLDEIRSGQSSFVVHGTIGNGKSVSLLLIAASLHGEGYSVFNYLEHSERLTKELAQIRVEKSVILFEDAFGRLGELQYIRENVGPHIPIIATCRTAAYELRQADLRGALGEQLSTFSLNQLRLVERERLSKCLLGLGFFGRYSASPHRLPGLIQEWGNDTRSTMLKLFEDSDIGDRLKRGIEVAVATNRSVADVLIVMFLLAIAEVRSDIDSCDELLDLSSYPLIQRHADLFRDLFDVLFDRVQIRSSVVSEYCLQHVFRDEQIIDTLIRVGNNQRGKSFVDGGAWTILRHFMRYGFIEPLLTSQRKRHQLLRYFEAMRENSFYAKRPHFWLQYAIAEMAVGRYPIAKTYLDTARSYGEKIPNYRFTFIDNHFARYLLESRSRSVAESPDYYVSFLKVTNILMSEMKSEGQPHYTARVARYLAEFFQRAAPALSAAERREADVRLVTLSNALLQKAKGDSSHVFVDAAQALAQARAILNGESLLSVIRGNDYDFAIDVLT